jgi:ABC-type molybdate transport system substrate-binding protein
MFTIALTVAAAGVAVEPQPVEAAQKKVVIVVGPVGSMTAGFKRYANEVAEQATNHGAKVIKVYSPNATWARVKRAAQGANVLVYMGHGNG